MQVVAIYYIIGIVISAFVLVLIKKYRPGIKGWLGEKSMGTNLLDLPQTIYHVLNNVLIQNGEKTTQIDHVVVSPYGIFVIETKNWNGFIYGEPKIKTGRRSPTEEIMNL